jgi:hypothetical protein
VFEIIEDQQECFVAEVVEQLGFQLAFAVEREAERLDNGRNERVAARERLQSHEYGAVLILGCDCAGRLDCQARLAAPTQARQREQPTFGVHEPCGDLP